MAIISRKRITMTNFNNQAYKTLVNDLINDAFYLEGASRRGTIAKIRQYAEVVVRRILNLPSDATVELGNGKLQYKIKEKNNMPLLNAVKAINKIGSECTHTKSTREITEEDVNNTINHLFVLYASLLIEYFEKNEFGSNAEIVHSFSILPPIIRYITLDYLYNKYPDNIMIIDKMSLILLKALNKEAAIKWIEDRKEILEGKHSVTEKGYKAMVDKLGAEFASILYSDAPNMYNLCIERIELVSEVIKINGKLYDDFESAIDFYQKNGIVSGSSPEIKEFNSIMEFLYLGRRSNRGE